MPFSITFSGDDLTRIVDDALLPIDPRLHVNHNLQNNRSNEETEKRYILPHFEIITGESIVYSNAETEIQSYHDHANCGFVHELHREDT